MDGGRGLIAKVALSAATYAIDKPYDYQVPAGSCPLCRPGVRVIVPFGAGNRRIQGLVLGGGAGRPGGEKPLKQVQTVLDDSPVLDAGALRLALWMRERWFCTVYDAARAMLQPDCTTPSKTAGTLPTGWTAPAAYEAAGKSENARRLLELLFACDGCADMTQIRLAFSGRDPNPALKHLSQQGIITLETSASPGGGGIRPSRWPRCAFPRRRPWPRCPTGANPLPCAMRWWSCCAPSAPPPPRSCAISPEPPPPPCVLWKRAGLSPWSSRRSSAG